LVRFTNGGEVLPVRDGRAKGATLRPPRTKRGNPLLVEVPPDAARAAKRLLGKEWRFSRALAFTRLLKRKCKAANVTPFGAGQFRHTVATWALEAGAPIESIATFLNHQSPETTRRFYATHGVPARVPTLPLAPVKRKGKGKRRKPRLRLVL
jgi:integrase